MPAVFRCALVAVWVVLGSGTARAEDAEPLREDEPHGEATREGPGDDLQDQLTPPVLVHLPTVPYPAGLDRGTQQVELRLLIDASGSVERVDLVAGEQPFASLASAAAAELGFEAAREGGVPVAVEVPFTWDFPEPPVDLRLVVRENGSRNPVSGLAVVVGARSGHTDESGSLELRNLAPGTHRVQVVEPGWSQPELELVLEADEVADVQLWITREHGDGEAVAFYRARPEASVHHTVSREQARAMPGSLGDPVRALQNLPGLVRTPFDAGWLLVRGGEPEDTGVFLDGVRVPQLYHLGGFTSIIHPEMVEEIRFHPGAYPSRYGGALSGIADLVPRRIPGDVRSVAGFNLVWAHAFVEAPLGDRAGVALAARRSYLDGVLSLVLDPERAAIAPRFTDVQARIDSRRAGLMIVGMSDAIDLPSGDGAETLTVTQRAGLVQGHLDVPAGNGRVGLQTWLVYRVHDVQTDWREEDEEQLYPGLRVEWRTGTKAPVDLLAGLEGEYRSYRISRNADQRRTPTSHLDPYASLTLAGDLLSARAGLRLQTLFVPGHLPRAGLAPRGSVEWRPAPGLSVVGELGRTVQSPPDVLLLGLPDGAYLDLESSTGGSVGLGWTRDQVQLEAAVWLRQMRGLAGYERDLSVGQLQGTANGAELTASWRTEATDAQLVYQYTRSWRREEPADPWSVQRYDQPHRLNALVVLRLPGAWTLSGRFRYASGFPLDGEATSAYDILTQQERALEPNSAGRLRAFHALDLKVAKRLTWQAWRLEAYLDVQNVTNRRIAEPAINGIDDTEAVYGFGLPVLPIFGVDATFWP